MSERELLEEKIKELGRVLSFLDKCRADLLALETGAYKDAHEWLESVVREIVRLENDALHVDLIVSEAFSREEVRATHGLPPLAP
jgi:hypothetical protein